MTQTESRSESTSLAVIDESLSVDRVIARLETIQDLMRRAMAQGTDYGQIPGTKGKPTLLKPGAEKLCVMFRLAPEYKTEKAFDAGHLTVESTCRILDMHGQFLGEASAMCSTRESKYAYRTGERVCPKCGKSAIIKGRAEYGGGWLCWKKKDGCGLNFADDDTAITSQVVGRVANPDIADSYNTVLRIAEKRAYLAAVRLVTGSSALFDEEIPGQTEHAVEDDGTHQAAKSDPLIPAWIADYAAKVRAATTLPELQRLGNSVKELYGRLEPEELKVATPALKALSNQLIARKAEFAEKPAPPDPKQVIMDQLVQLHGRERVAEVAAELGLATLDAMSLEDLNRLSLSLAAPF